ncbi:MAG: cytochrome c oxidase assembly factor Coa1 family protein [Chitinophagaceae bacterium]|nr:cytochrome c oxidase assembly factor Coa1 family protein [Chitinophagaceae bacterium]
MKSLIYKITTITIFLLLYGYISRIIGINFFWESKSLGWLLFWFVLILILFEKIKKRKSKYILEKIAIGVFFLIISVKIIFFISIRQTSAYTVAVNYIKSSPEIKRKVGNIESVFVEPFGSISLTSNIQGESGRASLYFIIKGMNKFADINLYMEKDFSSEWQVLSINK